MLFTGEDIHSIDSKQRLAIPAGTRSAMDRAQLAPVFYIVLGPNNSLWLWPEATFERMAGSLEQTLMPGDTMLEFDEVTFPLARRVELDSAGRVRIPQEMLDDSGLGATVAVLGMRDHLELRDPEQWKEERKRLRARQTEIMLRAREAYLQSQPGRSTLGGGGERRPSAGNG